MDVSTAIVIITLVFGTTGARRQFAQESQSQPAARLAEHAGENVRVTDAAGVTLSGTLWAVRPDEIAVMTDGVARSVKFERITLVEQADSIKDGAVKGALLGLANGILAVLMKEGGEGPEAIPVSVVVYGLIGAIIDSLHTVWTPLYVRENRARIVSARSPRTTVTLRVRF